MEEPAVEPGRLDILETCLYVDDLDEAERFYREVLGLAPLSRVPGRHVFFRLERSVFLLFQPQASARGGDLPPHGARGPGHCCFKIAEREYEAWKARLKRSGVMIEAEYAWPRGGKSLYFRDPSGNLLELAPATIWPLETQTP